MHTNWNAARDGMSKLRASSSPNLLPSSDPERHVDDSSIVKGATAKVRLLLKLVQDYEVAARDGGSGAPSGRQPHSIAGILCVLDDVKSGLERSHATARRRDAELRRCNTDLRRGSGGGGDVAAAVCPGGPPHGKDHRRPPGTPVEENQRLRKELSASMAARKSLEKMFSSLGKEKEIMATELQRKAHELRDMEEHISDLKAQNEMLLEKVQRCAAEHREMRMTSRTVSNGDAATSTAAYEKALQDRNKALSEQLLKALDGYRSLKRRLKEAQEENVGVQATVAEVVGQVSVGLERIREFCRGVVGKGEVAAPAAGDGDVEKEISSIERTFRGLQLIMSSAVAGVGKGKKVNCSKSEPSVVVV